MTHLYKKLEDISQNHLLDQINKSEDLTLFHHQLENLDISFLHQQLETLSQPPSLIAFSPPQTFDLSGKDPNLQRIGNGLLKEKRVGCVVLAGGQGSRLKCKGPKGLFPISAVKNKTLFQMIAEKVLAASHLSKQKLPLAFMTSPINNEQTRAYFDSHEYFGLSPHQVSFFQQPLWPLLDLDGKLFLDDCNSIALGPNGNGCFAKMMLSSGLWDQWKAEGIEMVSVIPIDNPLALPFDPELFGYHFLENNDVTIKTVLRNHPTEDIGVLAIDSATNKTTVIEYSEIPDQERFAQNSEGRLKYPLGNIGLYCLSMDFIKTASEAPLPIHKACKYTKKFSGGQISDEQAWKFEEFIFDLFRYGNRCSTLVYPRDVCFAPLKNLKGNHSPETVRQALNTRERQLYRDATGKDVTPNTTFELEASFYYASHSSFAQRQNKAFFKESFIEAT
ncbi:UTP--glucose-1-phosphate uridylyltransferase [Chlamydiifrater phoenicopteri]|uniref:UTP--glucose-1-phosphate uridylyltransferase n=1 Tax=Chlamydiifrater phoenicopteri TaxID=2681469 RepID=UPI001BCBB6C4|nr:UTP--glucose-1-phosphate uridylyltransferase [Chlamydiifrater phoenicopteri]